MYTPEGVRTIMQSLLMGTIFLVYNKPIAGELTRLFLAPLKWVAGEKLWVTKMQGYVSVWMRLTLYVVSLILFIKVVILQQ